MRIHELVRAAVPVLFVAALWRCGKSSTGPSQVTSTVPISTTSTTTVPTPTPAAATCTKLGLGDPAARCNTASSAFQGTVDAAINKVLAQHGEIFQNGAGGILTTNFGKFTVELIKNLDDAGVCGGFDGEEIQVANSTNFSEQFKVVTSQGYVRIGSSYKSTCNPAAFPTPAPGLIPPPAGCHLASSSAIACGPWAQSYIGPLNDAIDLVVSQHPEVFDTNDRIGDNGYYVRDLKKYFDLVAAALIDKGYCAHFDGEEMTVKVTDEFTDHYDILTGDNHIRRGSGQYRTSCYPAAF